MILPLLLSTIGGFPWSQETWDLQEPALEQELSQTFSAWSIQNLELPQSSGFPFRTAVHFANFATLDLELEPYSVRSGDFRLWVQGENGELRLTPPPTARTYRGHVAALTDSRVAASLIDGQLHAYIDLGNEEWTWWIQPLQDFVADAADYEYLVYRSDWVIAPEDARCGMNSTLNRFEDSLRKQGNSSGRGSADVTAEIGIDVDSLFYSATGGLTQAVDEVENILNSTEVIYQRDVQICYDLSTLVVRTNAANDPYAASPDPGFLLDTLRNEWLGPLNSEPRDMAHLISGHPNTTGVVGLAYVGVTCNKTWHYGISLYFTSLYTMTGLIAHELGHNWNSGHCNGSDPCYIMCGGLGGCTGDLSLFAPVSITAISSYRDAVSCLDAGCGLPPGPLVLGEPFPGVAGLTNTILVQEATRNEVVSLYAGRSLGFYNVPGCSGVVMAIQNPKVVSSGPAGALGEITLFGHVSASLQGQLVILQALEASTCRISNAVLYVFQ